MTEALVHVRFLVQALLLSELLSIPPVLLSPVQVFPDLYR